MAEYKVLENGHFVEVVGKNTDTGEEEYKDVEEQVIREAWLSHDNHLEYFEKRNADPRTAKQALRRGEAFDAIATAITANPMPAKVEYKTISDATYLQMMRTPKETLAENGIELLRDYIHKLTRVRLPYAGEVGTIQVPGQPLKFLRLENARENLGGGGAILIGDKNK